MYWRPLDVVTTFGRVPFSSKKALPTEVCKSLFFAASSSKFLEQPIRKNVIKQKATAVQKDFIGNVPSENE
jgi:hypothetical protein